MEWFSNFIVGGREYVWWFSPHSNVVLFSVVIRFYVVGENTQERRSFYTLVLPSLNRFVSMIILAVYSRCRGDYTGRRINYYSRSPLSEPEFYRFGVLPS